jgi:putative serine protease PepD
MDTTEQGIPAPDDGAIEAPGAPYEPVPAPQAPDAGAAADEPVRVSTGEAPPPMKKGMPPAAVAGLGVLVAVLLAAVVGFAAGFLGAALGSHVNPAPPDRITVIPPRTTEPVAAAAAAALGSVVNIDVSGPSSANSSLVPTGHPNVPMQGNGSGVAFRRTPDGGTYILTNNHVVEGAKAITITDTDGIPQKATLVGTDPEVDIAVLRVAAKLPLVQIGDSDRLVVGEMAVAIGSPFGLQHSVTSGVVSAIHRSLSGATDFGGGSNLLDAIQTDAAINPGNSGGALVDRTGRLIGINTAIFADGGGSSSGVGFAIPVNTAVRAAGELIRTGKASHPFLGIEGRSVDASLTAEKKLPVDYGAYVGSVIAGTGAQRAGVKSGDVIVKVGDRPVRTFPDMQSAVRSLAVGDRVPLVLYRDGARRTVVLVVGDRPAD